MKEYNTRLIEIDDYISNHQQALKEHITFDKPKFIIKGDTGLGGTTAVIENTTHGVILIEPLQSIIKAKKASCKPVEGRRVYFAVEGEEGRSKPLLELIADPSQPFVYVCTADLLMTLIDNRQIDVEQLVKIPLFVDEVHIALTASAYRTNPPKFLDIVYNCWEANYTLASATYVKDFLDIPLRIRNQLKYIRVNRKEAQPKNLQVIPDKPDIFLTAIEKNLKKRERTVIFTNHLSTINRIIQAFGEDVTQVMVGKRLLPQLAQLKQLEELESNPTKSGQIDPDKLIYLLSSAFDTGFDFPHDAHVMVFARQHLDVDSRTYLDVIQAFGRVRSAIGSNTLVLSTSRPSPNNPKIDNNQTNYCLSNFEEIYKHTKEITYNTGTLGSILDEYGFRVNNEATFAKQIFLERDFRSNNPKEKITTLRKQGFDVLSDLFYREKSRLSLKGEIGSSFRLVTEYAVAYSLVYYSRNPYIKSILKDIEEAKSSSVRLDRLVHKLFIFFFLNNSDFKHAINEVYYPTKKELALVENSDGRMEGEVDDIAIEYYNTMHGRGLNIDAMHIIVYAHCFNRVKKIGLPTRNTFDTEVDELKQDVKNEIIKQMAPFGEVTADSLFRYRSQITPTNLKNQVAKARKRSENHEMKVKDLISSLNNAKSSALMWYIWEGINPSDKQRMELFKNHHLFMLSKLIAASDKGFKVSKIDFREYNPSTKCPRYLRYDKSPYKSVEYDIHSANAQHVDSLLGSGIAFKVYENIVKAEGCDRDMAKVKYNSALNSTHMGVKKKIKFFIDACGYTEAQAKRLADITSQTGRDKFFYGATKFEQKMIDEFVMNNWLDEGWTRVHDAIIIPQYRAKEITYGLNHFGVTEH